MSILCLNARSRNLEREEGARGERQKTRTRERGTRTALPLALSFLLCFFLIWVFFARVSEAQRLEPELGALSPEELLLAPERLEAGEGGIAERWQPIRSFLEKGLQKFDRGIAQVSLTRALLLAQGWQSAQDFAASINDPVWRSRALITIASAQFSTPNGQRFGRSNLDTAFSILRSIPENQLGQGGEEGFRLAGELFARQGLFPQVSQYLQAEQQVRPRTRFLEGALPYLSSSAFGLVQEEHDTFINDLLLQATRRSRLEDLLRLSDYSQQQGRGRSANRLLFEAYRRTLLLPPSEKRNADLVRVARHMLANNAFRDALRAIRRVENPFLQSGLLAETGRRMIQNKMEYAGQPLLSLANDLARTLEAEQQRRAFTRLAVEYALAGDLEQAWEVLQEIQTPYARAKGILAVALVLAESDDIEGALGLLKFIPDANLRARFVIHTAPQIEKRQGSRRLTDFMLELIDANDFLEASQLSSLSPRNVEGLLEAQLDYGQGRRNRTLFDKIDARVRAPNQSTFDQMRAEVRFLRINARRSERHANEAHKRIDSLLRGLWVYHSDPQYPSIVETAVAFFVAQGDLTRAFTLVQALPKSRDEEEQERQDRLLATIAFQATRRANENMALRAVASIQKNERKALTLAKVIDIAAHIP